MDTLARYNWTLAKILMAVVLTAMLLGGLCAVGMVGYGVYVAAKPKPEKRYVSDEEVYSVLRESAAKRVNR